MANYAITSINFGNDNQVMTLPYGSCSTAAGTAAKTVSAGDFSLETGAAVVVKFTNTNTASNPTLNVSSTGAKAIYHKGAAINPNYLRAGFVYTFTYNGTQWDLHSALDVSAKIQTWSSATSPSSSVDIDELIINKVANANVLADMQASGKINENEIYFVEGDAVEYVTQSEMEAAIADIVDTAPETLNTLNELAAALGDDPNFATTITTQIGNKVDKVSGKGLSTNDYTNADKSKLAGLATVATTGKYSDLADKPSIPSGAAASKGVDTSISTGSSSTNLPTSKAVAAFVEGKGYKTTDNNTTYTFATGTTNGTFTVTPLNGTAQSVAIKGLGSLAYSSATIPTVNNGTLTIQRNGTNVATFSANQSGNATANITDNDTLTTAGSSNSTNKLFLVGAGSQSATGVTTYSNSGVYMQNGSLTASTVYGAVWNDYAEYREGTEDFEPGRVICENGDDTLSLATERLQPGANVVSDTFGFAIGETEKAKTPIAVSGRVLVYPYEDRNSYKPGDAVCAAPGGTVSKMTREEIREYPERILGTVSAIPTYEVWGEGKAKVNGRIWIKVR